MADDPTELQNELEALLKEVENPATADVAEDASGDAEKLLNDVKRMAQEEVQQERASVSPFPSLSSSHSSSEERSGTMSLDLTGDVTLDLKLNFGSQTVYISVDSDNLLVQLADGTSFRIPFVSPQSAKQAA